MEGGMKVMEQRFVNRFARRRAAINKANKDNKEDTEKIIKLFKNGYECPVAGPWLVELNAYEAADLQWKEVFEDFLAAKYEKRYKDAELARLKAQLQIKKIQDGAPKKPVVKILCKDNPAYKKEEKKSAAA